LNLVVDIFRLNPVHFRLKTYCRADTGEYSKFFYLLLLALLSLFEYRAYLDKGRDGQKIQAEIPAMTRL